MEEWPQIWRVAANILKKQLWTDSKEWSSSLGFGQGANSSSVYKTGLVTQQTHGLTLYCNLNSGMCSTETGGKYL
jgi:hypothetical protein